ncbi:helix-turn-helix domain-containing protein [Pedobacter heparinus]|uniref:helix-turn-helix domain-containing protein n=1 Tax=Pedobacter heparinus TaxID=984 RepID=UPI00292F3A53|nr:helix-turn-helix domain-containing protein [Pedobacter heparinus]
MNDIEQLLQKLNKMVPLSKEYEKKLCPLIKKVKKKSGFKFIKTGQVVKKSWQVLSGYVIAFTKGTSGEQLAMNIYTQGQFFTEMPSLLNQSPARYDFVAIGEVEAFELTKAKLSKLRKYPEGDKLLLATSVDDYERETLKDKMLLLPETERIISFFENYNISDLPDKYAASFLRMTLEDYLELKVMLLASRQIKPAMPNPELGIQTFSRQTVYEVKQYLQSNFTRQDIGNTIKIASLFNTTKKTLTRMFNQVLGTTVHKMILKLRMEKALSLLAENTSSIKEVSEAVGYKDLYYFNKEFKKYHGFASKEAPLRGL